MLPPTYLVYITIRVFGAMMPMSFDRKGFCLFEWIIFAIMITFCRWETDERRHQLSWIPFGAGPRQCVGMRFALIEEKLALCRILRRFNIDKAIDTEVRDNEFSKTYLFIHSESTTSQRFVDDIARTCDNSINTTLRLRTMLDIRSSIIDYQSIDCIVKMYSNVD